MFFILVSDFLLLTRMEQSRKKNWKKDFSVKQFKASLVHTSVLFFSIAFITTMLLTKCCHNLAGWCLVFLVQLIYVLSFNCFKVHILLLFIEFFYLFIGFLVWLLMLFNKFF